MDDAFLVRRREPPRDLQADLQRPEHARLAGRHEVGERLPLEELQDDVRPVLRLPEVVDVEDVGVIQGADGASLL